MKIFKIVLISLLLAGCNDDWYFRHGAQVDAKIQKETYGKDLELNNNCIIHVYISNILEEQKDIAFRAKLLTPECEK